MTPLRQRMLEDMRLRNLSPETQRRDIHYVADFAKYFKRSPENLGVEAIREYQLYLIDERKMSLQSVNCFTAAAQFLYTITLELPWSKSHFPRQCVPGKLPVILSPTEVAQLFDLIAVVKHRPVLMTCYGAGLRISEAVSLKVSDIDSSRMTIRAAFGQASRDPARLLTAPASHEMALSSHQATRTYQRGHGSTDLSGRPTYSKTEKISESSRFCSATNANPVAATRPPSAPVPRPTFELADILRQHGPAYRAAHPLPLEQLKVMRAIETCRTAALGGHVEVCGHCQHQRISYKPRSGSWESGQGGK